ncbi:hypothetical protein A2769_00320 [Candidatus Daviesbacteria bacterium RIFCSPHIGHO2_01_FULL_37_27]|nr:MAG: hypothetical protein A2769_00320 [Candidatus Daviesbacteria bacterium RIFCSPHIGHO2_01_FULL_37_27]
MNQLEISSSCQTKEFNPLRELSELKAAVSSASKEDKKLSWYRNAEKDLKALEKDFKKHPEWVQSQTINSSEFYIISQSAESLQSTPEQDVAVQQPGKIGQWYEEGMSVAEIDAHLDISLPWPDAEPSNIVNFQEVVEKRAKRSRTSEFLRARSAAQMNFRLVGIIGGVAALSALGYIGYLGYNFFRGSQETSPTPVTAPANPRQESGNEYITIQFNDPDMNFAETLRAQNLPSYDGNIASLTGQIEASYADAHGIYDAQGKKVNVLDLEEAKTSDTNFNTKIQNGIKKIHEINPQAPTHPANDDLLITGDINQRHGFNYLTVEQWKEFFNQTGEYIPVPVQVPETESEPEAESAAPALAGQQETGGSRRGAPARLPDSFRAGPESYICSDGVRSVADAIVKAQANKCLYDSLTGRGMDITRITGTEGSLASILAQNPALRDRFPLNQDMEMYVKRGNEVKTIRFQFSDSQKTDLLSANKVVNINDGVVWLTDGSLDALLMKLCGNLVIGFQQPKAVPTEAPATQTPAPAEPEAPVPATLVPSRATATPRSTEVSATPTMRVISLPPELRPAIPQPGQGTILKYCDNPQIGLFGLLDPTDLPCDATFNVEFLDPTGNFVIHRLSNLNTTNGRLIVTSPEPGMLFRATERLDLLPANLRLIKDDVIGRTVSAGVNVDPRNLEVAWALNGPAIQEQRFEVCVDIFGRREFRTEKELRDLAASLGINPGFSIPDLQREIANKRCVISVASTLIPTPFPTSTGTPFVFFNPSPTPESQRTSTPTPDMTPTPPRGTVPPQTALPSSTIGIPGATETPVPTVSRIPTNTPPGAPSPTSEIARTPTPTNKPTIQPQTALPSSTIGQPGATETPRPVSTRIPTSTPPGQNSQGSASGNPTPRPTIGPSGR